MGRHALTVATATLHGQEPILRYLDAAWADCVVSVDSGAAHLLCAASADHRLNLAFNRISMTGVT